MAILKVEWVMKKHPKRKVAADVDRLLTCRCLPEITNYICDEHMEGRVETEFGDELYYGHWVLV